MVYIYYCTKCGFSKIIKNGLTVPICSTCHRNYSNVVLSDDEYSIYKKEIEDKGIIKFLQDHNIDPCHNWPMRSYDLNSEEHNGI